MFANVAKSKCMCTTCVPPARPSPLALPTHLPLPPPAPERLALDLGTVGPSVTAPFRDSKEWLGLGTRRQGAATLSAPEWGCLVCVRGWPGGSPETSPPPCLAGAGASPRPNARPQEGLRLLPRRPLSATGWRPHTDRRGRWIRFSFPHMKGRLGELPDSPEALPWGGGGALHDPGHR